jgi:hypothetical protein
MLSFTRSYLIILPLLFLSACGNKDNNASEKGSNAPKDSTKLKAPGKNENPYAIVDVSPMDMSYCPADYPKLKMAKTTNAEPWARIIYSRPHLQGRQLFLDLLKYGEPWRLGANESTELDLYTDATIQDKKIKAGRYILYCIPEADTWTIILNSNIDSWGLHPDSTKDMVSFKIPVKQTANHLEYFTMIFENNNKNAVLVMAWDNLKARLQLKF